MAKNKTERPILDSYDLQDVEVSWVSGQTPGFFQGESPGRLLTLAPLRVHNVHVRGGKKRLPKGCRICRQGLEGAMEASEEEAELERRRVAESDRIDKERSAAHSRGDGSVDAAYKVLFGQDGDEQKVPGQ